MYYIPPGYEAGLKEAGYEILAWETFGDWQGDYSLVLKNGNDFGFVVIGYGSCSGCDSMEACETEEEYKSLISSIVSSIFWGTKEEVLAKINNEHDDNNWYRSDIGYEDSVSNLIKAVREN